jgi:hypothetical protein
MGIDEFLLSPPELLPKTRETDWQNYCNHITQ